MRRRAIARKRQATAEIPEAALLQVQLQEAQNQLREIERQMAVTEDNGNKFIVNFIIRIFFYTVKNYQTDHPN